MTEIVWTLIALAGMHLCYRTAKREGYIRPYRLKRSPRVKHPDYIVRVSCPRCLVYHDDNHKLYHADE